MRRLACRIHTAWMPISSLTQDDMKAGCFGSVIQGSRTYMKTQIFDIIGIFWGGGRISAAFVVGQMVYIKWHQRECQQRGFLSKFHWSNIITVAHFSSHGPHCSGWYLDLQHLRAAPEQLGWTQLCSCKKRPSPKNFVESCTQAKFPLPPHVQDAANHLESVFNLYN